MKKINYIIYKHTLMLDCHSKGKAYIGQTKSTANKRWRPNGEGYLHEGNNGQIPIFGKAIFKYGWNNFKHEILETGIQTLEEANEKERYYIAKYHTYIYDKNAWGYNMTKGGDGSIGFKHSEATKQIIKQRLHEVFPNGMVSPMKGKKHTPEAREKIRLRNLQRPRETFIGHHPSQETKDKISKTLTGRKQPQDVINKRMQTFKKIKMFEMLWTPIIQLSLDNKFIKEWKNMSSITAELGIKTGNICKVCQGLRPTAGGFKWKYKTVKEN